MAGTPAGASVAAAKAGVDEAALAAQRKAVEGAALANVETRSPAKAAADEAAVAAQVRAAEAAALANVEMRSPAKAAQEAEAAAARQKAAQAAANVEKGSLVKTSLEGAALAAQVPAPAPALVPGASSGAVGAVRLPTSQASSTRVAPLGPGLVSVSPQGQVSLPALSTDVLNALTKPDGTPEKGRFQVSLGRTFDTPVVVNSTAAPAAQWTILPDGWLVWRVQVSSKGALGLRVHLESVSLPEGVRVIAYDAANPAPDATPITAQSLHGETEVWTETVFSDSVMVECQVPPGMDPAGVAFSVTGLSHLYIPLFPTGPQPKSAESCENDVTCYAAWANEASGVARIYFISGGNGYLCSGCLLDTVPTTFIDYFLTANHCIGDQATASTLEAWWFYQTSTCNGAPPSLGSVPHTTGGADLLATQTRATGNDFSFLRLRTPSPGGVEYEGWNTGNPGGADTLVSIHHPAADYKRISFGNTTGNNANYWFMQWYSGVTEHGSSGCPLFDTGHRVIGQLWGGGSDCSTPTGIDEYGRFNVTYPNITYWLYPPANDVQGGAIALADSFSYYSEWTTNATDDTGLTCSSSGTISKGVWFSFVPNLTGTATVDTCASGFDTKIEIFNSSMTSLGCNDDSCGVQSSFSFPCTAGATYYICAGGYNGASGLLYIRAHSVCLPSAVPSNDQCAGAFSLGDGPFYYYEDTSCATDDTGLPCSSSGTISKGVWFTYTANVTGNATVDTCASDFDTKIEIFSGACGALTSLGCNDDSCGLQSSFTFPCTAGTTYHICAGGYGGHSGSLYIRAQAFCTTGTLYNDTCATPYFLLDSFNYTWENTTCGNDDTGLPCSGTISKGVWFSYTPTVTGTSVVDTCASDFDTKIEVFSGACGGLTSLACNDDSCGLQSRLTFPCTAGTTYHICAGGFGGHSGNLYIRAYSLCYSGPPPNDSCTNAYLLTDSSDYFYENTSCAMDDTNLPCTGAFTIYRGVWFKFVATDTGTATVDTCGGSDFDTKIVVFSGTCGALNVIGCNDDSCGLQSRFTFPSTNGTTYYICAGGYGGHAGNLYIRAYSTCTGGAPANDLCSGAKFLPDSQLYTTQNTTCALDDTNLPCTVTMYRGVWFRYIPTVSGNATVDTCGSDFDTKIAIYSGTCGALAQIGCNDDSSVCGTGSFQSSFTFPCTAGASYLICAGGYGGHAGNLKIRAFSICTTTPANDLCGGAIPLAENVYYSQNTGCATDQPATPCIGVNYHGVWFTYTPAVSGWAAVDTCGSDYDTKLEVFSGNCGALTSLGCNDDSSICGIFSLQSYVGFSCTAGTTYHICAGGYGGSFGNLQIRARTTAPPNDVCAGALPLTDNTYYLENTGTATDDGGLPLVSYNTLFKGVWFYYAPVRSGTLSVDTCPSDYDTKIEIFSGACGALTALNWNDDSSVCGNLSRQSALSIPATCGTTYYICAGGFYTNYSGNLQIRAALTPTRPSLAISTVGTNIVLSWPTNYPCFTLCSATKLPSLPTGWTVVSPVPSIVADRYVVTNGIAPNAHFYRLQ